MKIKSAAVYSYERIIASLEAYRLFNPMERANLQINRGVVDGEFSTTAIKESDIVVFQREFPSNLSNYLSVMSQAANLGKPVVMDLDDDLLALPIHHPDRIKLNYAKAQIPILTGMLQAKALTVTTPYLADRLKKFNSNVFILPNYLDDSLWEFNPPQVEPAAEKIRIFYMGTVTHVPDLEMLKPVFRALAMKYPGRLEFVFYGANLIFEENIPATITNHQSETFVYADYVKIALAQKANIAIAPLEDIPYNHCKSSIKFFEYTAMGLPGVYSRVTPYSSVIDEGVNGFTASTTSEWINNLSRLIESTLLRETMTLSAQETVRGNWLLSDHAHLWPETYAQIAELNTANQSTLAEYLPVFEDINIHLDSFFQKQWHEKAESDWHLQDRAQALMAKSAEIAELNWQVQQANQALAEKIGHNDILHGRLDELSRENERLSSELTLQSKDSSNQKLEKARTLELLAQMKSQVDTLSRENERLSSELTLRSKDSTNQKLENARALELLAQMKSQVDTLSRENERLSSELTLQSKDSTNRELENARNLELLAQMKSQVDDLGVQWIDHTRRIQTLESENRFIKEGWDATKLEAVNYTLSSSWRVTRTMRKILKFLRGK